MILDQGRGEVRLSVRESMLWHEPSDTFDVRQLARLMAIRAMQRATAVHTSFVIRKSKLLGGEPLETITLSSV